MVMQIRRTATANNPPTNLAEGQLAVELANSPARLWVGVPPAIDPSGRRPVGLQDAPADGELYARRDGAWSLVPIPEAPDDASVVPLGGRLRPTVSSAAPAVAYFPFNGGWMRVNGRDYVLPATGIFGSATGAVVDGVAGQTLAVNTLYRVYLFVAAGNLAMEFSQTGHETSSQPGNVGTEIKQGDNSRTLVGLVLTGANGLFYDTQQFRLTRSWLNRGLTVFGAFGDASAFTAALSTTLAQVNFVCFADESTSVSVNGGWTSANQIVQYVGITNDFVDAGSVPFVLYPGMPGTGSASGVNTWAEGNHNVALGVAVSAGTSTGTGSITGVY